MHRDELGVVGERGRACAAHCFLQGHRRAAVQQRVAQSYAEQQLDCVK